MEHNTQFDEVSVEIELPFDVVVGGGGKRGRQAAEEDGERIPGREIGGIDGIDGGGHVGASFGIKRVGSVDLN